MGVKVKERPAGSGVYWLFICHKGKRKCKRIGKDQALAMKVAKRLDAKLTLDQLGFATGTFGDYAERWIHVDVPAKNKPSTIRSYTAILQQHVKPVFGSRPVGEITRADVKEFLQRKVAGLAPATVKHFKSVISGVLSVAMDEGAIQSNPAKQLGKWTRERNIDDDVDPLTRDELRRLLDTIRVHYPACYDFALTLARTGMRLGEVKALQWGDIDFVGRCIRVERSFSMRTVGKPKSGKGRRVDMSRQLAQALQARHSAQAPAKLTEWVFQNGAGNAIDADKFRRLVFKPALVKAGLRDVRIHDLRHTFASLLIEQGESLPYIRDQLGHHSIKITVDIYGHLQPGGNVGAVDKLDDQAVAKEVGQIVPPQVNIESNKEIQENKEIKSLGIMDDQVVSKQVGEFHPPQPSIESNKESQENKEIKSLGIMDEVSDFPLAGAGERQQDANIRNWNNNVQLEVSKLLH